ncbi:unnamed protein product [Lymnaea stagnalis]|uniref:Uncharacterized protein n=1 Tax=Lymnaea stagnalis TaxID=6523 RepID=A0AAV2INE8_LYMST
MILEMTNLMTYVGSFIIIMSTVVNAQLSVCEFNPTTVPVFANMTLVSYAEVNSNAVKGTAPNYSVQFDSISYMGMKVLKNGSAAGPDIEIHYNVQQYDTCTNPDKINISLTLKNLEPSALSFISMKIDLDSKLNAFWDTGIPTNSVLIDRTYVEYNNSLDCNSSITIHFIAVPAGNGGINLPEGINYFFATIYFTYLNTTYGTIWPSICILKKTTIIENIIYQHGFTALTFFIMLLVGIGLAVLAVWLFICIRRRRRDASITPTKSDGKGIKGQRKKIVVDAKAAMRSGINSIKDFSLIAWNDSLVFILGLRDKLHMYREIDNLDILSTIHVDTDLETEQSDTAIQASLLLVQGLRYNGDISKTTEDKAYQNMLSELKALEKKLDADYKKELESIFTDIEAKNKEKLGDLMRKHKEHRQDVLRLAKDMKETDTKKITELIDKQQEMEENELIYNLALEQNEDVEKLRKEYAIRKRMHVKEMQQKFIREVIDNGKLTNDKAQWLLKQHKQQQEKIAHKYDDEISRQRMILEEKLARRRALAKATETQDDDHIETLNMIASIQVNLIQKLKTSKKLTSEQAEDYMDKTKAQLEAVKEANDKNREVKQQELFKKLTQEKQMALAEKVKQHSVQLQEYVTKNKALQTEGPVDPVSYVNGLVTIKSGHREELSQLENKIDEAQAQDLFTLREQLSQNAKQELDKMEQQLIENVKSQGIQDDEIEKIMKKHKKSVQDLEERQKTNRRNQETKLKLELERRKKEWDEMRAKEKQEQHDLREYEAEVVDKLLGSQVAISDSERDRILKEHEKQMVQLENSLTLNKLRQKRMLEEKIALRRAQQVEELQQKQNAELAKHRRIAEDNGEEDEPETREKELTIRKKHAEQQIALIQGVDFNFEKELEEIRIEMIKERALALKDQEERLGALIVSLQMNKAREMAKIEEQQKAINNLKANMLDDLNARGILTTPECEMILNRHKEEQENLNEKLEKERAKQEKMLQLKLQERLKQREELMSQKQEEELKMLLEQATNKTSAKIRHALLMHKQLVQMEKFKNKWQREINQSLEDTKRDFQLQKQKKVQEKELEFLSGLIKIGGFERNELLDVLRMLFPGKTEKAITDMLNIIDVEDKKSPSKTASQRSTLRDRVYMTRYSQKLLRQGAVNSTASEYRSDRKILRNESSLSIASYTDGIKNRNQFGPQDYNRKSSMLSPTPPFETARSFSPSYQYQSQDDSYRKSHLNSAYSDEDDEDEYPRPETRNNFKKRDNYDKVQVRGNNYTLEDRQYYDEEEDSGAETNGGYLTHDIKYLGKLPPLKDTAKPTKKKKTLLKKLAKHESDEED